MENNSYSDKTKTEVDPHREIRNYFSEIESNNYFQFLPNELIVKIIENVKDNKQMLSLRTVSRKFKEVVDYVISNKDPLLDTYKKNYENKLYDELEILQHIYTKHGFANVYLNHLKKYINYYFKWKCNTGLSRRFYHIIKILCLFTDALPIKKNVYNILKYLKIFDGPEQFHRFILGIYDVRSTELISYLLDEVIWNNHNNVIRYLFDNDNDKYNINFRHHIIEMIIDKMVFHNKQLDLVNIIFNIRKMYGCYYRRLASILMKLKNNMFISEECFKSNIHLLIKYKRYKTFKKMINRYKLDPNFIVNGKTLLQIILKFDTNMKCWIRSNCKFIVFLLKNKRFNPIVNDQIQDLYKWLKGKAVCFGSADKIKRLYNKFGVYLPLEVRKESEDSEDSIDSYDYYSSEY